MSVDKRSNKQRLFIWSSMFALSLCVVYAVYSLASVIAAFSLVDKILFGSLGIAVWAIVVFFLLARMGYYLELNLVKGNYEQSLAIGLLITVAALAIGVVLVILGFVGIVAIVPIGLLILSLSLLFSSEFFSMKLVYFSLRILIVALIIGSIIGALGFLV